MSELITVTNGIETLKIHPSTLKAHERAGWKVVPEKAALAKASEPEAKKEAPAEKSTKAKVVKGKPETADEAKKEAPAENA